MRHVRLAGERGHVQLGWLDARHSFSFGSYHDPRYHQFRVLRVMNEDRVAPRGGFPTHPHRDMEIVTYILAGSLEHRDSLGNGSRLTAGEFQRMSAGTGVEHSEFNPSATDPVHVYQIWLYPARKGLTPEYEQRAFPDHELANDLRLIADPAGTRGALTIHQDARLYLGRLTTGVSVTQHLKSDRHAWIQLLRGSAEVDGISLSAGDGLAVSDETGVNITALSPAEILLFDLP